MTRGSFRMILAACMVATVAACDDDDLLVQVGLNGGLPLVDAFQSHWTFPGDNPEEWIRIAYSFTNRTDRTLFLFDGCGDVAVDRLADDEWVPVWPPPDYLCPLVELNAHWLAPGEPFGDIFEVRRSDRWTSGDYRVRLRVFAEGKTRGEAQENPISRPLRVSPPFALEVPLAGGSPGG